MARETWNDDQLDKAFDRVDADLRELRAEVRGLRSDMVKGFERVDEKFDGKFDSLQRTMIIGFVTLFASIFASVVGAVVAALALG